MMASDFVNKSKIFFFYYGGLDLVLLAILVLIGMALPEKVFNENPSVFTAWLPGIDANLSVTINNTEIIQSFWIKDPSHNRPYKDESAETINTSILTVLTGPLPFIYIILASIVLYCLDSKTFNKTILWKELIAFTYVYVLAMSITYWITKGAKQWVSWPRPYFYDVCMLNDSNIQSLHCEQTNTAEVFNIWKSFPSGHSSYLLTVTTIVYYWTSAKLNIKYFEQKYNNFQCKFLYQTWDFKILVQFIMGIPVLFGLWVGFTRLTDLQHFPADVCGGFMIGFLAGYVGYLSQYQWNQPFCKRLELEKVLTQDNECKTSSPINEKDTGSVEIEQN